ncbi:hypothetical protein FU139_23850, partial [Burkholderia territorii]
MSARIARAAAPRKARRPLRALPVRAARDTSGCREAQMWCAAALSACDIAVRDDGARCTPMPPRVRRAAARPPACRPSS